LTFDLIRAFHIHEIETRLPFCAGQRGAFFLEVLNIQTGESGIRHAYSKLAIDGNRLPTTNDGAAWSAMY
jgi:hypothetical protein